VTPAAGAGSLIVNGSYSQGSAGTLSIGLAGTAAGTGYSQLVVNGGVSLDGSLAVSLSFLSAVGDQFKILHDGGSVGISGAFAGLPEGSVILLNGQRFQITYVGGAGNDVVLTHLNTPPTLANVAVTSPINEGSTATLTGTIVDPDPLDTHTLVINWGDGSANTTINLAAGATTFSGTHPYLEESASQPNGSYPISLTVQDNDGAQANAGTAVQVTDAALAASGTTVTPVTKTAFTGVVASFTDADPNGSAGDNTATITWGDGHTSAGTIAASGSGGFTVTGTNTYAADGTYAVSVTITDAGAGSTTASSTAYVGGLATHFKVSAATAATAGTPFAVTVAALDAKGNPAYNYTGTVQFSSNDPSAVLPGNYTFTAGDLGMHVFMTVTLETAGTHSVTATDTVTGITGKQTGIVVSPAAVSQFKVVMSAGSVTAGKALSVTVTAQDAYGNTVTNYNGTVHFTSSDSQAELPADYTFVPGTDNGVHKFAAAVTLKTAGSQTVTVRDTSNGSVAGTSGTVTVGPAAATHFMLSAPASVARGVLFSFTVTALDAYGNVATGYTGTVHFTSSDGRAVLPIDYTFQASDAGVVTFQAILNTAGVQSLTATDTKHKTITGEDASIQVS
jgi:hypothetical protein